MKNNNLQNISVIGAGFLGTQIGLQCAAHGLSVSLVDTSEKALRHSEKVVEILQALLQTDADDGTSDPLYEADKSPQLETVWRAILPAVEPSPA